VYTIEEAAVDTCDPDSITSISYLLTKLVRLGVFPLAPPTTRSQPSFFMANLATIRRRLNSEGRGSYSKIWSDALRSLTSLFTLQAIVTSLLALLSDIVPSLDPSTSQRALILREATLLRCLVGRLPADDTEAWECFTAVAFGRDWGESRARIFVCWVAGADKESIDEPGTVLLLLPLSQG
jgi:telomere length regulation protein